MRESPQAERMDFYGVNFGLKLPTGKRDLSNAEGALAERSLQPGTGTTDLLLGGYFTRMLGSGSSWFADALVQAPLDARDNYQPGTRVRSTRVTGASLARRWRGMLQLNAAVQGPRQGQRSGARRERRHLPVREPGG